MDNGDLNNLIYDSRELKADIIQPINRETVHRICSGQVVLSLSIAVKELVENAIDASATNIEIRLKEYGSDLVEVSDNGTGVRKENFGALTLKHYTSKIRQFSDLESVSTLGFRGEALSSLCALADLSIVTKHTTAEHGTKIQYDHNGKIVDESPAARPQGTTVSLSNLFATLPVRRKEFLKNLKREFNKMCQLMYAYCLVSKGIKFTCTNQTNKGSKSTVMSTQGLNTVRDNIVGVFGSKQISSLVEVTSVEPEETILQEYSLKRAVAEEVPFKFEWFISSPTHGCGRSTTDRQFYFINSRPCEPTKVMKLINETYRQFNGHQYPFVYMNILTETNQIDVNVTPDKRQIFMEKEKLLLATIKASLLETFKQFPSTYKMQNLNVTKQIEERSSLSATTSPRGLKRNLSQCTNSPSHSKTVLDAFRKKPRSEAEEDVGETEKLPLMDPPQPKNHQLVLEDFSFKQTAMAEKHQPEDVVCSLQKSTVKEDCLVDVAVMERIKMKNENEIPIECEESEVVDAKKTTLPEKSEKMFVMSTDVAVSKPNKPTVVMNVCMANIREAVKKMNADTAKVAKEDEICVKFRSQITPDANKSAEQELQKQISKDMFGQMEIIGQFNLGFIIAKLNNDLFIIDQHATDEKYNFEQLQATTVLENQLLVSPKCLQLTAANEEMLIENEEIFKKNGFSFKIDHSAEATKKISLTAIPVSKNYIFGKDDIDEMLFMLQDNSNTMVRPSRVRAMFASRACRKSVMVGKSLSRNEMRRLVNHMGEIDQPWNCPHGRPTMRHLINLDLLVHKD